jgi:hypothetical protein
MRLIRQKMNSCLGASETFLEMVVDAMSVVLQSRHATVNSFVVTLQSSVNAHLSVSTIIS